MWPFSKRKKPEAPAAQAAAQSRPAIFDQKMSEMYAEAKNAVMWFNDHLYDDPILGEIRDENELAAPKSALVNAFCIVLAVEDDETIRSHLLQTGLMLSHFQAGIGGHPLRMLPVKSIEGIDPDRLSNLIHSHKGEHDRFQAMYPKVQADMHAMADRYQKSIDVSVARAAKYGER
ncbi:hypothetical protein N5K21_22390 [Rhizobium pusense]|uniref:Uncharacterized protein n=1 Tax=Agrobacterium pusense TaxID=648995 RepID=A0A6H0ZQX6_9HYPH|nr:hypothetical protein [Agrobacterium pusense]MDH2091484.1 hypothetical protein [Agrobacterium pusense]QIX22623.1 hypothetical protein FOB41_16485 [Agrobacterium pusense]WCK24535.1 hypothetical protein CFBP5496_0002785 [Agrobacterium pusense]